MFTPFGDADFLSVSSRIADENRQFFQRGTACSWQHDIVGGIVQLQGMEGNSDEFASKSGKVADFEHNVDVVVFAKNEIADSADCFALIVDNRF